MSEKQNSVSEDNSDIKNELMGIQDMIDRKFTFFAYNFIAKKAKQG